MNEFARNGFNSNISGAYNKKLNRISSICHISAGELLRDAMVNESNAFSREISSTIKNGGIVKAQITVSLLNAAISKHLNLLKQPFIHQSSLNVILIDGFPRNMSNMEAWNEHSNYSSLPTVINFKCPDDILLQRLQSRMLHSNRTDDNISSIHKRIQTYHNQTVPIIEYYDKKYKERIHHIDATRSVLDIYNDIKLILTCC